MRYGSWSGFFLLLLILFTLPSLPLPASQKGDRGRPYREWRVYGGDPGQTRYSPLKQIDRSNVARLKVAWTFHTGHLRGEEKYVVFQNSPLVIDGTLYLCTPHNEIVALDPETGEQRWRFDPDLDGDASYIMNCRGVSQWLDPVEPDGVCGRRIIMGTVDARMIEVDARTGQYKWHFQTVHHDLWDTDMPSAGGLFEVERNGTRVPVIAQVGKSAFFYVLDRTTGQPFHEVRETPVPKGDVPTEW